MKLKKETVLELITAYIFVFALGFMLFIYEPIFMYAVNMDDFWFDFSIMIKPTLKIGGIFFLITITAVTLFYFVDRLFDKKRTVFHIMILAGSVLFYILYIQGNWMVKNLPPLDGSEIIWENYGRIENKIIIAAGIVFCAVIILLVKKCGLKKTVRRLTLVSTVVLVMLSVSLVSTVTGYNALKRKDGVVFSMKNFNNISENQNFLIFLADAVDAGTFSRILNDSPEYKNIFEDFTFYSDAASVYPYTRDAIPQILSGSINRNEKEFSEYSSDAYNHSKLFSMLEEEGYSLNLYDHELIWNGNREYGVSNADSIYNIRIDLTDYAKQELRWILFKYLPYSLKKYSKINDLNFNKCYYDWKNASIYTEIASHNQLDKQADSMFQFVHVEGAHEPFRYDKDLNIISGGTYSQAIEASITLIKEYIQRLKENGAYDNSIIVIMADHGYCTEPVSELSENILYRYNPVLLIKGYQEKHEFLETDTPVSYADLTDAYHDLLAGKKSTELFQNIDSNLTRKVIYYEYLKEDQMVEYEIRGRAKDAKEFRQTGNFFDRQ